MAVNKVVVNGVVKLDLTADTVDAEHLATGYTAHDKSGATITGTMAAAPAFPQGTAIRTAKLTSTGQSVASIPFEPAKSYYLVATFVYSYAGTHEIRACVYTLKNSVLTLRNNVGGEPIIALSVSASGTITATVGGGNYQYVSLTLIPE